MLTNVLLKDAQDIAGAIAVLQKRVLRLQTEEDATKKMLEEVSAYRRSVKSDATGVRHHRKSMDMPECGSALKAEERAARDVMGECDSLISALSSVIVSIPPLVADIKVVITEQQRALEADRVCLHPVAPAPVPSMARPADVSRLLWMRIENIVKCAVDLRARVTTALAQCKRRMNGARSHAMDEIRRVALKEQTMQRRMQHEDRRLELDMAVLHRKRREAQEAVSDRVGPRDNLSRQLVLPRSEQVRLTMKSLQDTMDGEITGYNGTLQKLDDEERVLMKQKESVRSLLLQETTRVKDSVASLAVVHAPKGPKTKNPRQRIGTLVAQ